MKSSKKIFLLFLIIFTLSNAYAVSFDCNKASRIFEKAICSNIELSKLDDELNVAYKNAVSINPEIKISQRDWIKSSRLCENNLSSLDQCIKNAYSDRLVILRNQKNNSSVQPDQSEVRVNASPQDKDNSKNKLLAKNEAPPKESTNSKPSDQHDDVRETKIVIVEGVGTDVPSATQNAAQNALTEIVGSFMDANKILEKKTEIRDGIRSQTTQITTDIKEYSQGTIKSFELINIVKQSGLIRATARVAVRMDDLRIYVKKLAEGEVEVNSGLFAQMATEKKQQENQSGLLADKIFMSVINGEVLDLKVGIPRPISQFEKSKAFDSSNLYLIQEKYGSANVIFFDVEISLNENFYQNMRKILTATTVDSTSTKVRPGDSFSVSKACQNLKSTYPNDLCFFIDEEINGSSLVEVFNAKNSRIEMLQKMPWLKDNIPFSFRVDATNGGVPVPRLEIAFLDSNNKKLQFETIGATSRMDSVLLLNDYYQSPALYSLLTVDKSGHHIGFIKTRTVRVVMEISQSSLKETKKINVKFVK